VQEFGSSAESRPSPSIIEFLASMPCTADGLTIRVDDGGGRTRAKHIAAQ